MAACHAMHLLCSIAKQPNLELKTPAKWHLGSLLLDIVLPAWNLPTGMGREKLSKNCTVKVEQFPVDEKVDEIQVNVCKVDEI